MSDRSAFTDAVFRNYFPYLVHPTTSKCCAKYGELILTTTRMKILRPHAHIAPVTMIGTHLTASCTSIILTRASPETKIYLIVGKGNGEVGIQRARKEE